MEKAYRDEAVYGLAELFKIFGDPTRIRILYAMLDTERCVNDIAGILQMSQSSVSHQLRILKTSKLVKSRREGKSIFYSLDDEHVRANLNMGMEHIMEGAGKRPKHIILRWNAQTARRRCRKLLKKRRAWQRLWSAL